MKKNIPLLRKIKIQNLRSDNILELDKTCILLKPKLSLLRKILYSIS